MNSENRKGDWMQTYRGKKFWPLDPRPEEVEIEDIAHALAMMCRFNGHCNNFYSVAQHSVLVSNLVRPSDALAGLLHDGSEAYFADIIRPIKRSLGGIKEIEEKIAQAIFKRFRIDYNKEEISRADNIALFTEMRDLMGEPPETWREFELYQSLLLEDRIVALSPIEAERLFLERYARLNP